MAEVLGYAAIGGIVLVIVVCGIAPFILSGRIAEQEERAEKAGAAADSSVNSARKMAEAIPLGQPILLGHHSEKGDRNYRGKIDAKYRKGAELSNKAAELERRAEASEANTAIYADAVDPVAEIDARLAELRAKREQIKARPHESYELSNLGANIRRLEARRAQLAALKASARVERMVGEVRVVEDPEIARLQLFFPGKPDAEMRARLKQRGFRWAPSTRSWQRQLNNLSRYAAEAVLAGGRA